MEKIKEIIVVEGKNDASKLQQYFNCDTLITNGSHLSKDIIETIATYQAKRGVILFLDPDQIGEKIRAKINEQVPNCKNAYIDKSKAHTSKKVGIEHATKKDLEEALSNIWEYDLSTITLSYLDFCELNLANHSSSKDLRLKVGSHYNIGKCNAKTLWKRLNMLKITKEMLREIL